MEFPKQPVNRNWFNQFEYFNIWDDYAWLLQLGIRAEKIINYGCWTGVEPFVLLWMFDASEITVVEIDEIYLNGFEMRIKDLQVSNPQCLRGRSIELIHADMSLPIPTLASDHFDLAFCENVLYNLKFDRPDYGGVQNAINEIARVIRPSGYVVANEPKMGVKYEKAEGPLLPLIPLNDPTDVSHLFEKAGLFKSLDAPAPYLYIYSKLRGS